MPATIAAVDSSPLDVQSPMSPAPTRVAGEGSGVDTGTLGRAEAAVPDGAAEPLGAADGDGDRDSATDGSREGTPDAIAATDPTGEAEPLGAAVPRRTTAVAPMSRTSVATKTTAPRAT